MCLSQVELLQVAKPTLVGTKQVEENEVKYSKISNNFLYSKGGAVAESPSATCERK